MKYIKKIALALLALTSLTYTLTYAHNHSDYVYNCPSVRAVKHHLHVQRYILPDSTATWTWNMDPITERGITFKLANPPSVSTAEVNRPFVHSDHFYVDVTGPNSIDSKSNRLGDTTVICRYDANIIFNNHFINNAPLRLEAFPGRFPAPCTIFGEDLRCPNPNY